MSQRPRAPLGERPRPRGQRRAGRELRVRAHPAARPGLVRGRVLPRLSAVLTEAVTGVVGIADVLGGLGVLLALLALRLPRAVDAARRLPRQLLFGLFSKESAIVARAARLPGPRSLLSPALHPERPPRRSARSLALVAAAVALVVLHLVRRRLFPVALPAELARRSTGHEPRAPARVARVSPLVPAAAPARRSDQQSARRTPTCRTASRARCACMRAVSCSRLPLHVERRLLVSGRSPSRRRLIFPRASSGRCSSLCRRSPRSASGSRARGRRRVRGDASSSDPAAGRARSDWPQPAVDDRASSGEHGARRGRLVSGSRSPTSRTRTSRSSCRPCVRSASGTCRRSAPRSLLGSALVWLLRRFSRTGAAWRRSSPGFSLPGDLRAGTRSTTPTTSCSGGPRCAPCRGAPRRSSTTRSW